MLYDVHWVDFVLLLLCCWFIVITFYTHALCMSTVNKLQLSTQVLSSRTDLAPAHHRDPRRQVIEAMTKDLGKS